MIHFSHILFEPVLVRENFLSRLDSRIKVIFCIIAVMLNLILPTDIFQMALLVFYLAVALSWKVRMHYILGRLVMPFLLALLLIITRLSGLHLALVILAGVSVLSLLSFSTPIEDMLSGLGKFKCPKIFLEITYLMYKYIFIFFEELDAIYHAQVSRLGYVGLRNSLRSLGMLVGMLIIRSFQRASTCYEAILARGYKDKLFY